MILDIVKHILYGLVIAVPIMVFVILLYLFSLLQVIIIITGVVILLYLLGLALDDEIKWQKRKNLQ